jgi:hypothetical protein
MSELTLNDRIEKIAAELEAVAYLADQAGDGDKAARVRAEVRRVQALTLDPTRDLFDEDYEARPGDWAWVVGALQEKEAGSDDWLQSMELLRAMVPHLSEWAAYLITSDVRQTILDLLANDFTGDVTLSVYRDSVETLRSLGHVRS